MDLRHSSTTVGVPGGSGFPEAPSVARAHADPRASVRTEPRGRSTQAGWALERSELTRCSTAASGIGSHVGRFRASYIAS